MKKLLLLLLLPVSLCAQTVRPTYVSQIQWTELTTAQEAGMTLAEGSFWYNTDLNCYRGRSASSTACLIPAVVTIPQCDLFAGADAGTKITACIADLPATGGIADARGFEGAQAISADMFSGVTKPFLLLLGDATFTVTASSILPSNSAILGVGQDRTIFTTSSDIAVFQTAASADDIELAHMTVVYTADPATNTSSCLQGGGNESRVYVHDFECDNSYHGIRFSSTSTFSTTERVYAHDGGGAAVNDKGAAIWPSTDGRSINDRIENWGNSGGLGHHIRTDNQDRVIIIAPNSRNGNGTCLSFTASDGNVHSDFQVIGGLLDGCGQTTTGTPIGLNINGDVNNDMSSGLKNLRFVDLIIKNTGNATAADGTGTRIKDAVDFSFQGGEISDSKGSGAEVDDTSSDGSFNDVDFLRNGSIDGRGVLVDNGAHRISVKGGNVTGNGKGSSTNRSGVEFAGSGTPNEDSLVEGVNFSDNGGDNSSAIAQLLFNVVTRASAIGNTFYQPTPGSSAKNGMRVNAGSTVVLLDANRLSNHSGSDIANNAGAEVRGINLTEDGWEGIGALTLNAAGADVDTVVEGDTDANLFFVDAGNDRVGIGMNNPSVLFEVDGEAKVATFSTTGVSTNALKNPLEGTLSNVPRWILKVVDHTDMTAAATADDFVLWTLPANTMIHDVVGTVVTPWEAAVGLSAAVCSVGTAAGSANDLTLDDDFFAAATVYELHDATASGGKGALLYDATDKFAPFMLVASGDIEIQCDLTGDDHADTNAGQARIYILVSQPLANSTTEAN